MPGRQAASDLSTGYRRSISFDDIMEWLDFGDHSCAACFTLCKAVDSYGPFFSLGPASSVAGCYARKLGTRRAQNVCGHASRALSVP